MCSERLKSTHLWSLLVPRKDRIERKDSRNTCQKKLLNLGLPTDLLVVNLSSFCPSTLDPFWPLYISMKNTVRNWTSAHPSCSAVLLSSFMFWRVHLYSLFHLHTVNFFQDPLPWGLCPLLSTKTSFSQLPYYFFRAKVKVTAQFSFIHDVLS